MGQLLQSYLPLVIFIGIAFVISAILAFVPFVIAVRKPDPEKVSAYECGFEAFEDTRSQFDVRYYLVAILFIIFDLEITFFIPWALVLDELGAFGLLAMIVFVLELVVGFIYLWKKGALEWE